MLSIVDEIIDLILILSIRSMDEIKKIINRQYTIIIPIIEYYYV